MKYMKHENEFFKHDDIPRNAKKTAAVKKREKLRDITFLKDSKNELQGSARTCWNSLFYIVGLILHFQPSLLPHCERQGNA